MTKLDLLARGAAVHGAESAGRDGVIVSGATAIVWSLEMLGISHVFGIPGGNVIPLYDALMSSSTLRSILVRHEQGAGHAAEGFASATGGVGVAIATSGPGATNLVTAIADAYMDSVPTLFITGQVSSHLIGTDAFQEADIVGITLPITKHSYFISNADDIPSVLMAAYQLARAGRPGPVLVDIAKDAQQASTRFSWPITADPVDRPISRPQQKQVDAALALVLASTKPVIYVGGGVLHADAVVELAELATLTGAPVVTSLMARGAFPDSDPRHLGMPGGNGSVPAVLALQESDLIIALGTRFDSRVTGEPHVFAPAAKVIHVDVDPTEIAKVRNVEVPIVGDARKIIDELCQAYRQSRGAVPLDITSWWDYLVRLQAEFPYVTARIISDVCVDPEYVTARIGALSGAQAVYAIGAGHSQIWASRSMRFEAPRSWIKSGGAGTLGYPVPAAMGAKAAHPEKIVWAIDGQTGFQATNQELATCRLNGLAIKVAILNSGSSASLLDPRTPGRPSAVKAAETYKWSPDFVKMADAYGALGIRVTAADEVEAAIATALSTNDRPVIIDFQIANFMPALWPHASDAITRKRLQELRGLSPRWRQP